MLPPQALTWRETTRRGDLVGLAGLADDLVELVEVPELQIHPRPKAERTPIAGIRDYVEAPAYVDDTGRPGPSLLVIGDSYAEDYLEQYFLPHVSRYAYVHHWYCNFDPRVLDQVKPDLVVFIPVERNICDPKPGR